MYTAAALQLRDGDRARLESLTRASTVKAGLATRARIVLLAADGMPNTDIADRTGTTRRTVLEWRGRYQDCGIEGLDDDPRPGRAAVIDEIAVLSETLADRGKPPAHLGVTHWSARLMATRLGISFASVARIWRKWNIQPHRVETFKFSTDPELEAKLREVVGLYLDPPKGAVVVSVDEKSQYPGPGPISADSSSTISGEPHFGVGVELAGQFLVIAGDNPERIRNEKAFAKLCGVAPQPASSGRTTGRHRLCRSGDRQANSALYIVTIVRLRHHEPTRAYVERRTNEGLGKREIIRCLKRYIAREIYANLPRPQDNSLTRTANPPRLDKHRSSERYNRTLQCEWSYRRVFVSNADRARALAPWVEFYNTQRRHSALDGLPPISRPRPT